MLLRAWIDQGCPRSERSGNGWDAASNSRPKAPEPERPSVLSLIEPLESRFVRVAAALSDGRFMAAFRRTGCFTDVRTRVPVHLIVRHLTLFGVAQHGLTRVRKCDETER